MAKEDAPWLAEAPPPKNSSGKTRVSRRSLFITIAGALTLIAIVIIGAFLLVSRQDENNGDGYMEAAQAPLIPADTEPYKVKPEDPMGLDVEGQDQTLYAAGIGIDEGSLIDTAAIPEAPLPRPGTNIGTKVGTAKNLLPPAMTPENTPQNNPETAPPAPQTRPETPVKDPETAPKLPPKTPEKPIISNKPTAQLGAFSTKERAEAAWTSLTKKHGLIGSTPQITALERGGKTLWRLRAGGGNAAEICARLATSGDPCSVVNE